MTKDFIHTWFLIINPKAGGGLDKNKIEIILNRLSSSQVKYDSCETEYPGHAIVLAKSAIQKGYRKIIGIGGDGTNNEVVNGVLAQKEVLSTDITYCLLPVGTGNDWIKEHQIPIDLDKWIKMLNAGNEYIQDVGKVSYFINNKKEERYFANVAGMSYDAFVLKEMQSLKWTIKNKLAYLIYGLYYVFKFKIPKASVTIDGERKEDYFYLINAGICRYSGGGMQLVPHAVPDDGKLALTLVGQLSKIGVLLNSWRFYNGRIAGHSKVNTFYVENIQINAIDEPILIEVDGELLGETPVEITLIKKALKIIIP